MQEENWSGELSAVPAAGACMPGEWGIGTWEVLGHFLPQPLPHSSAGKSREDISPPLCLGKGQSTALTEHRVK